MLEEKIKEMIIEKYGSVRQFSIKINIPYTTVDSILKRGIDNSNVENIIRICNSLNISIDDLLNKRKITSIEESKKEFTFGSEVENTLNKISNEFNLPIEIVEDIFLNIKTDDNKELTYTNIKQHIQNWIKNNPKKKTMLNISKKEWEKLSNDLKNQENILNKVSENIYSLLKLDFEYQPNTEAEMDFDLNSYSNIKKLYDTLISLNLIKKGRLLKENEIDNINDFINNNSNMLKQILDNNYKEYLKEWNNFKNSPLYEKYISEIES
jgi:hypothetical protein